MPQTWPAVPPPCPPAALQSTTRYVTWSLHTKSRSSLKAMLSKVTTPAGKAKGAGGGAAEAQPDNVTDFLENTLWNRTLGSLSEEIVAALVCQIFEGEPQRAEVWHYVGFCGVLAEAGGPCACRRGTAHQLPCPAGSLSVVLPVLLPSSQASGTTLSRRWSSSSTASSSCPWLTPSPRACAPSWRCVTRP